jgi:lipoprotein-anchoring transpeptidase ErfK/SrfK
MNGLERVDKPRRWPLMVGLALMAVIVIGLAGWYYFQRPGVPVQDAAGTAATTEDGAKLPVEPVGSGQLAEEGEKLPVVTGVPPVEPVGSGQLAEEGAKAPVVTGVPPVEPVGSGQLAEADALLVADKKDLAREKYYEALAAGPEAALQATIEEKLGKLNVEMIRLPWPMAEKQEVVVQTNDAVKLIARKFGTTVEMIVKGNELKRPDIIRPGQRLKVFTGKMGIAVSKSRHDLLVTANGRFFKRYQVATGRYEKTPVGTFAVAERIPEPPWHRDDGKVIPFGDKENILGTRWMAIKSTGTTPEIRGYGIHGTWDNASIGKSESAGCIRLKNEDVEELFEMVPLGTSVVIEE